jgi:hypothetical protein
MPASTVGYKESQMRVAYLVNQYPMVQPQFHPQESLALESLGTPCFASRRGLGTADPGGSGRILSEREKDAVPAAGRSDGAPG